MSHENYLLWSLYTSISQAGNILTSFVVGIERCVYRGGNNNELILKLKSKNHHVLLLLLQNGLTCLSPRQVKAYQHVHGLIFFESSQPHVCYVLIWNTRLWSPSQNCNCIPVLQFFPCKSFPSEAIAEVKSYGNHVSLVSVEQFWCRVSCTFVGKMALSCKIS